MAQEKNGFYKVHLPDLMMNLLTWRSCFMFLALEHVKKKKMKKKWKLSKKHFANKQFNIWVKCFKNLHLFSSKSSHGYFSPHYFGGFLRISIFKFITFLYLLFFFFNCVLKYKISLVKNITDFRESYLNWWTHISSRGHRRCGHMSLTWKSKTRKTKPLPPSLPP